MNTVLRTLLFVSAAAPGAVVAGLVNWHAFGFDITHGSMIAIGAIGSIFPFLVMIAVRRQLAVLSFQAKKVESQDWVFVMFVLTYFAPVFLRTTDYAAFLSILVSVCLLMGATAIIPTHPVLHAFKYRFYKVEASNGVVYTLISKRKILNAADITAVRQISTDLLVEA